MSEQGSVKKSSLSRRDFLRLMAAGGVAIAFAPMIPFGNYMPNPKNENLGREKVILPDGSHANINSYPVNHAEVLTYPRTGDPALDAEAFRKWQLIRLPAELGGEANSVSAFRVYSNICVHLWCLWEYKTVSPQRPKNQLECPCHGSTYDPLTGVSTKGPASAQAAPSNALPKLDLEADQHGFLYIIPPELRVNANGVVGYGRFL
ncbi:MAG: Rieske 2Fe-2S domain-containing protein [Nitrosopumilaceae archaeon]